MNTSYTNEQYQEAAAFIAARITGNPETAIILGSGLGSLADRIQDAIVIPYAEIPHFMHQIQQQPRVVPAAKGAVPRAR